MATIDPQQLKRLMAEFTAMMRQSGIPPITDDQLDGFLAEAETLAEESLIRDRTLAPFARIIIPAVGIDTEPTAFDGGFARALPGGQLAILHIPLQLPDGDSEGKALLFGKLRFVCQALAAMAVIIVTDAWTLWDQKNGKPGTSEEGSLFAREHGTVAAANAGFGTLMEIITASAQTRDRIVTNTIPYERRFRGGVLSPGGQNPLGVPHQISVLNDKAWRVRCPEDYSPQRSRMILIYEGPTE